MQHAVHLIFGGLTLTCVVCMHIQMAGGLLGREFLVGLGFLLLLGHVARGLVGARNQCAGAGVGLDDQEAVKPTLDDMRFITDLLRVFHGRMVVRHQHAVVLDLETQVAVAQFEAQASHFLHRVNRNLNQLCGFNACEIALVFGFGEHIAILDGLANHDAELGAVLGHLAHALLIGFEPVEGNRHIKFAVAVLLTDDVAGDFFGDHPFSLEKIACGVRIPTSFMPQCREPVASLCNE